MSTSIIIIGAGAAGLQAGRRCSQAGHRVILLEAAAEPGGRILGLAPEGFRAPVEGGAEFIHGSLPLSLGLMKEAGIVLRAVKSEMVRRPAGSGGSAGSGDSGGEEEHGGVMGADWGALMEAMAGLTRDLPMAEFLATHFDGERYTSLRESARRFAEGYDLADLNRASTLALYKEWSGEEGEEEWRPVAGYRQMIDFLATECGRNGAELYYSSPVTEVSWQQGRVAAKTAGGRVYTADTLVVSVSLGVLASGDIRFHPALPEMEEGVRQLGFGSVIKILLEFKHPFWLDEKPKDQTLFILSDQPVPTWWTQTEEDSRLLTGWLAGDRMRRFQQLDEAGRVGSCLRSVAAIFSREVEELSAELVGILVLDWSLMPFVKGGYSYETVGAAKARASLSRPFGDTVYLCGEALYEGESPGTVEAALQSGWDVAEKIIAR
ncbi:MAG TPA: NAD(P)/FAD-dependent oxidoreductase [Puia sp.]